MPSPLKQSLQALAHAGVCVGTSSWKYPGWCGQLYDEQNYLTRGKFSKKRFEENCLTEYAQTFSTVCVDAGYYKFPDEPYLEKLSAQVPEGFRFSFKATDEITIKHFPNHRRHGHRAGMKNENFLNAALFREMFLRPCETIREKVGALIFEFSHFYERDFEHGRDFAAALDAFLDELPGGWQYAVEIRNPHFLHPDYFAMLAGHGVAHTFNSWTRMPPVSEQLAMPGSVTTDFVAGRFLLTPGRAYEQAVKEFGPYQETKVVDPDAREAGRALIEKAKKEGKRPSFIYVNNRLEGNALATIAAMLGEPGPLPISHPPLAASPKLREAGEPLLDESFSHLNVSHKMSAQEISMKLAGEGSVLHWLFRDAYLLIGHWEWLDDRHVFLFRAGAKDEHGADLLEFSEARVQNEKAVEFWDEAGNLVAFLSPIDDTFEQYESYAAAWIEWQLHGQLSAALIERTKRSFTS